MSSKCLPVVLSCLNRSSSGNFNKETIRCYIDILVEILVDTLLVERAPCFTHVDNNRRARQKDKFIFFDMGVRNIICGRRYDNLSKEELGALVDSMFASFHFVKLEV